MPSSSHGSWKRAFRSLYYQQAPEPEDPILERGKLALLVIDVQNVYLARPDSATLDAPGRVNYDAWTGFHERMRETVMPTIQRLLDRFRRDHGRHLFDRLAGVACQQMPRQIGDVGPAFAQRRNVDGDAVQAKKEILPEMPLHDE